MKSQNLQENITRIKSVMGLISEQVDVTVPKKAIEAISKIEGIYAYMDNGKIYGSTYTGSEKLGVMGEYIKDTIGIDCWNNMSDKMKAQIYSFCFQADTSIPYKMKFIAGLSNAIDSSINRSKIVGKPLTDPNVRNAINVIKSNCKNINDFYYKYLKVIDNQYNSMDYNDNYKYIWKYRPIAIDRIMNNEDINSVLSDWKSSFSSNTNKPIISNTEKIKPNKVLYGIRDIDGKTYKIEIKRAVEGSENQYIAIVTGPGKYQNKDLSQGLELELYSDTSDIIGGNSELGSFKIK